MGAVSLPLTLLALAVAVGLMVFFGWQGARPLDVSRVQPRMAPWRLLMVLTSAVVIFLLIHLVQILGPLLPR